MIRKSDSTSFVTVLVYLSPLTIFCLMLLGGCQETENALKSPSIKNAEAQSDGALRDAEIKDAIANIRADLKSKEDAESWQSEDEAAIDDEQDEPNRTTQTIEIPETWKRLGKAEEIWIDMQAKEVIVAGHVCLRQGALEMFICPEYTKEHESVIAAHALSHQVHVALIKLGADPGKSASWDPEYRPAHGPSIAVTLKWQDKETGKTQSMPAQQWIRDFTTKKAMEHEWVFGGSSFWEDPDTGTQVYNGDSGELICLSNFSTATIDVNVESSESNEGLLFEAFTENIPPIGTKVYAIIKPGKRIEPAKRLDKQPATALDGDHSTKAETKPEVKQDEETGQPTTEIDR